MVQRRLFGDDALPEMEPGPEWETIAMNAVYAVARMHVTLTPNEVWAAMPVRTPVTRRRAMGAIMNRAKAQGWIESTGQFQASGSHGRPVPIYRSRVIQKLANSA